MRVKNAKDGAVLRLPRHYSGDSDCELTLTEVATGSTRVCAVRDQGNCPGYWDLLVDMAGMADGEWAWRVAGDSRGVLMVGSGSKKDQTVCFGSDPGAIEFE